MFKFQYHNGKRTKKLFWVTKRVNKGIKKRAIEITNKGTFRDFKLGQKDFKSGQRLQIGARGISNQGRNYKSVQSSFTWPKTFNILFQKHLNFYSGKKVVS